MKTQWPIQVILPNSTIWQCAVIVLWPGKIYSQTEISSSLSSPTSWEPGWSFPSKLQRAPGPGKRGCPPAFTRLRSKAEGGDAGELLKYDIWKYAPVCICKYACVYMNVHIYIFKLCKRILVYLTFVWHTKFLKSPSGSFSDFCFLFLTIHSGTKHFPECLNCSSQENYERFLVGKISLKCTGY